VAGKHQLLGAEVSYYTGKVRAYLRYKDIPFEEVLASREVYKNVIVPRTGVSYIPVLISDDDVAVQDTTDIIDFLEARYPDPSIYPQTPVQRLVALLFEVYADEWLVIPAMHYRWNYPENRAFAIREFGALSAPQASPEEQLAIGEKVAVPFAGALPPLGVTPNSAPAIEQSYLGFLADFEAHLAEYPFLLGTRPSLGDFALYGPLYAHLYRDPYSGRLMRERAPRVAQWVERMRDPQPRSGEFIGGDEVPVMLIPMLRRMFAEQGPVLLNTMRALDRWAAEHPGEKLPRAIGKHEYRIGDVTEERMIYPYNIWMWQRPYDYFHSLRGGDRGRAEMLLREAQGLETIEAPIPRRVKRENNRVVLA